MGTGFSKKLNYHMNKQ